MSDLAGAVIFLTFLAILLIVFLNINPYAPINLTGVAP